MLNRLIFNRIGALVIGVIVLAVGFYLFSATDVKCGDDVMQPGDTCITTTDGKSVERNYDEQKKENALVSYITLGVGGVILAGGVIANVVHYRKKKPATSEPAPTA